MQLTVEDFIKAGYTIYDVPFFELDWAKTFLQKRIKDKVGTKYFVNIYFGRRSQLLYAKGIFEMATTTLWFKYGPVLSIKDAEALFEDLWQQTGAEYYETT